MHRLTFLIIVMLSALITSRSFAQSKWISLNPNPTGFTLRDVMYTNDNTLWVVGDDGTMLKSNDEGRSWTAKDSQTNAHLFDITFYGNRGWIVGTKGTILFSDDFGQSWRAQNSNTSKTLHKVEFIDEHSGWILAVDSLILRTTNGGLSWEKDTLKHYFGTSNFSWPLNDIEFVSPNVGWLAVGYYQPANLDIEPSSKGALLKTADGGKTWAIVDSGDTKYTSIYFLNEFSGWITTNNVDSGRVILRTDDGGETWTKLGFVFDWQKMYFHSPQNGWGIYMTSIGRTTDGGATWSIDNYMDPPAPESGFKGLFFRSGTSGWTVGSSGFILKTDNSGESWSHLDNRLDIFYAALDDVTFTDEKEGWIVGWQLRSYPESDSSIVLHTIDGGLSWERQAIPYNGRVSRIWAIDNSRLWAIGGNQTFFTIDGGRNWQIANVRAEEGMFREIYFRDGLNGFLMTDRVIYKTSNGGLNWSRQASGFEVQFLRRIAFADKSRGWLLGKTAISFPTYETTNGGQSWNRSTHEFTAITFLDSLTGFAIENGSVHRSVDGGNSWIQVSEDPAKFAPWTSNMTFTDTTNGWIWNWFNVYHTNNGGRTWLLEKGISGISDVFPGGLFMRNKDIGWAVGAGGLIFKYAPDNTTAVFNPSRNSPSDFKLFQNYPNPFNPTTTIRYFLPLRAQIEISLFNLLGQKVKILFSGMQNPGVHDIELDRTELPSGIFFYQLKTDSFVETKKCMIVR